MTNVTRSGNSFATTNDVRRMEAGSELNILEVLYAISGCFNEEYSSSTTYYI